MKKTSSNAWLLLIPAVIAFSSCDQIKALIDSGKNAASTESTAKVTLTLSKNLFTPGEVITVKYVALPEYETNAWIGIIPSSVKHGSESLNDQHDVVYKYLRKSTGGEMSFNAPGTPGDYDLRMNDTDNNGVEVASVSFKVAGDPSAPTTRFVVGNPVMVEWKGRWWPARVISLRKGNSPYKIHYDGYSASWDEWISNARIRNR